MELAVARMRWFQRHMARSRGWPQRYAVGDAPPVDDGAVDRAIDAYEARAKRMARHKAPARLRRLTTQRQMQAVGHEGDSVRDVHYGRELLTAAREAVDGIPAVDWSGPKADEQPNNVVPMRRS